MTSPSDQRATSPSTHTPEGASNKDVNVHLDKLTIDRELREIDAPWFGRRYWATLYSRSRLGYWV
jgi:predicted nicotinamide N-methyase